MCEIGQPTTDTLWAIGTDRFLEIYLLDDSVADVYYSRFFAPFGISTPFTSSGSGTLGTYIAKVSSSELVVDQKITGLQAFQHYVNGLLVDSVVNITTDKYITFTILN
jgi:hypothetical protein